MLYNQSAYTTPLDYIISTYIREYDIAKANINILLYKGMITQAQYEYYYNLPRMERQIQIGLLQRDNQEVNHAINNGFKEVMELFFKTNGILDHEVVSIKKDAIYLMNKIPEVTHFRNIEFVQKNIYTSFYKINKVSYFYFCNNMNGSEKIDVKGISDTVLPLHEKYFLEFLLIVFNSAQTEPVESTIEIIQGFYNKYINRELELGYYRMFNNRSTFTIGHRFEAEHLPEDKKEYVDIEFNSVIVRELYKIFSNIYFQRKNKR